MFNNYRIPREYLLNRTADVTPEGVYESSFTDPGRILGAALEMLSAARVAIIQENTCVIASAVTIAVRYAALRKQFGSKDNEEISLIEYPLHVSFNVNKKKNSIIIFVYFLCSNGDCFRMLQRAMFLSYLLRA